MAGMCDDGVCKSFMYFQWRRQRNEEGQEREGTDGDMGGVEDEGVETG